MDNAHSVSRCRGRLIIFRTAIITRAILRTNGDRGILTCPQSNIGSLLISTVIDDHLINIAGNTQAVHAITALGHSGAGPAVIRIRAFVPIIEVDIIPAIGYFFDVNGDIGNSCCSGIRPMPVPIVFHSNRCRKAGGNHYITSLVTITIIDNHPADVAGNIQAKLTGHIFRHCRAGPTVIRTTVIPVIQVDSIPVSGCFYGDGIGTDLRQRISLCDGVIRNLLGDYQVGGEVTIRLIDLDSFVLAQTTKVDSVIAGCVICVVQIAGFGGGNTHQRSLVGGVSTEEVITLEQLTVGAKILSGQAVVQNVDAVLDIRDIDRHADNRVHVLFKRRQIGDIRVFQVHQQIERVRTCIGVIHLIAAIALCNFRICVRTTELIANSGCVGAAAADGIKEASILGQLVAESSGCFNRVLFQLVIRNEQVMTCPLVIGGRAGDINTVDILALDDCCAGGAGCCEGVNRVIKQTSLFLLVSKPVVNSADRDCSITPQAGAAEEAAGIAGSGLAVGIFQGPQEGDQLIFRGNLDSNCVQLVRLIFGAIAINGNHQVGAIQFITVRVGRSDTGECNGFFAGAVVGDGSSCVLIRIRIHLVDHQGVAARRNIFQSHSAVGGILRTGAIHVYRAVKTGNRNIAVTRQLNGFNGRLTVGNKTLLVIQSYTNVAVLKVQVVELAVALVGHREAILNELVALDSAAVRNFLFALVGSLIRLQSGVRNTDVGEDPAVSAPAVTLHVVEVEGIALAFHQVQLLSTGDLRCGAAGICQNVLCPFNVVIDVHGDLGNGVGRADIQNQLAVDEQVNVIVTFELEEQVIFRVVDELTVGDHGVVIVSVDEGSTFLGHAHNAVAVIQEVGRLGLTCVDTCCIGNRQEGETGGGVFTLVINLILGSGGGQGNGALFLIILYGMLAACAVCIRIGSIGCVAGGKASIKDVTGLTVILCGLAQHQVVVLVLRLVVGVLHVQVHQQIVGRVHEGGDVVLNLQILANQFVRLGKRFSIGADFGSIGGLTTAVLAVGEAVAQPGADGRCQVIGLRLGIVGVAILLAVFGAGNEVVVVVAARIGLAHRQRVPQQIGNVTHCVLFIVGDTVGIAFLILHSDQPGLQQTGSHDAAVDLVIQGITQIQFAHVIIGFAIAVCGSLGTAFQTACQQPHGIRDRIAIVLRSITDGVEFGSGIIVILIRANLIVEITVGIGVVAAGDVRRAVISVGVPAAALVCVQHTEGNVVAGIPPFLGGLGEAGYGSGLAVHVVGSLLTIEGIGGADINHSDIQPLICTGRTCQTGRQIQANLISIGVIISQIVL